MELKYWQEFVLESKNILLLQGPIGPFFYQFGQDLERNYNKKVCKLNFNGGDLFYYRSGDCVFNYSASIDKFKSFLQEFVQAQNIDAVVCFGHHRAYHVLAKEVCVESHGAISFWAFEEGYLRPHYITFEKWGVNGDSQLSRDAGFYQDTLPFYSYQEPVSVASGFAPRAWYATNYYMAQYLSKDVFSSYMHHREDKVMRYIGAWLRSGWRKIFYKPKEYLFSKSIQNGLLGEFFIVPLQVHDDSQVSKFGGGYSVPSFLRSVFSSFAKNAPSTTRLVVKHHPMDRGFNHYGHLIEALSKHYNLVGRVYYTFDIPMPVILRKAKGMVVLNSTTAISAMIHGMPVKILGEAQYNFAGLADQQNLAEFWVNPQQPDYCVFRNYRSYLSYKTQLNANFYKKYSKVNLSQQFFFRESNIANEV